MSPSKSIFLKALNREILPTAPIWYMRQAGRYMPEYRAIRKKFSNFMDMCKNPEVCCELALQPLNAYELDAAILFSDILTVPDALGMEVNFVEGKGPIFNNPINTANDIFNLPIFNPENVSYVFEAVSNIKNAIHEDIPLIGFTGSPWTLAAYSIEGQSSKNFNKTISFLKEQPHAMETLLTMLTDACFIYLRKQVQSGADVVQIFDSWANLLNEKEIESISNKYIKNLIQYLKQDSITKDIPIILFSRDPKCSSNSLIDTKADCLSLYSTMVNFEKELTYGRVAIQGNLNPKILLESRNIIKDETYKILSKYKDYPGYIFNLGHGITPDINPDNVKYLTDIVREF